MFIKNDEKKYLFDMVKALIKDMGLAANEITVLKGKLKAAEGNIFVLKQIADMNNISSKIKPKPKKVLTPEQKAKQREYMKRYLAKKKAQKALEKK
jgi:hypothetical protein